MYQIVQDYDVLFCLEAYHVGTHFQFSSESEIDKTRRYDLPPGIKEGRDDPFAISFIKILTRLTATERYTALTGDYNPWECDLGNKNFYLCTNTRTTGWLF